MKISLVINGDPTEVGMIPATACSMSCAARATLASSTAATTARAAPAPCWWTACWSTPARGWPSSAMERAITTIEGIGSPKDLHPLQQAFIDHGAIQCGYCTPGPGHGRGGAAGRRIPIPTEAEVRDAIAGVLCRCTGYKKPVEAILAAAHDLRMARRSRQPVSRPMAPYPPFWRAADEQRDPQTHRMRRAGRQRAHDTCLPDPAASEACAPR